MAAPAADKGEAVGGFVASSEAAAPVAAASSGDGFGDDDFGDFGDSDDVPRQ
mgnify:CR=1 FL=1